MHRLSGIALLFISASAAAQFHSASIGSLRSAPSPQSFAPAHLATSLGRSPSSPGTGLERPHTGIVGSFGISPNHRRTHFPFFRRSLFDNGFERGLFEAGFLGEEPVVVNQEPGPVVVEVAPPAQPVAEDPKPGPPLLIERQGDRFVRLSSADANPIRGNDYSQPTNLQPQRSQSSPATRRRILSKSRQNTESPSEPPPAILVFRDGRQLSIASYAIIGPTLYQSAGYWTDGYWTRKIELADLDLPATVRLNHHRGVEFLLPAAPNQVITRP